ncbi:hypothetical protein OVA24_09355 [Luteolibacter sp. SL250]|uniref:hypothetical protein n=1 Tax=Luteolibacter sp. SL250 TaxID=2995170 RepID=UPI00227183FA|nr:hypothetical protein [Luteolibacter sp. SL250]WAC21589.1 hypothetical protein OVA24_09355 [Luteolibacter sp. SL250]
MPVIQIGAMHLVNQRLWKIIGGGALGAASAAGLVAIRLAMATHQPEEEQGHAETVRELEASVMKEDIAALLSKDTDGKLERWMEADPAGVMAHIDSMEDRGLAVELAGRFVKAIRNPHHDLLLDWLARQKDGRIAALVFQAILPRMAREDVDRCIALSFNLGDGTEARTAREALFSELPLEQRMRLLEQQKPDERAELLGKKAAGFGARAPEACLEMIAELPPSTHRSEAVAGLMKSWANGADAFRLADPVSAVKAVQTITDPELRNECLRQAVLEWSDRNPDLASQWITKLPTGPDKDAAIGALVTRLAPADPATATEWAATISDEALRSETIRRLGEQPSSKLKKEP